MSPSKFLVYQMPASPAQLRAVSSVAAALLILFISTQFFRTELFQTQKIPAREAFVTLSSVILVMADWVIATLLLAQARVLQARPLYVLAAAYFLAGLFLTLRILSLPGMLGPLERRADQHYNVPLWFYLSSHAALPLAIMPYAWLSQAGGGALRTEPPRHRLSGRTLAGSMIAAASVVLGLAVGATFLPWSSPIFLASVAVMLLTIAGMAVLGRRAHSELDLWLLLMLWGWFLELGLIAISSVGYTAGWYAARTLGMVSGLFVLIALLAETRKLYAQTALQLIAQTQEREHRFLVRDVMSASIAHELRQPLAAILINAEVARKITSGQGKEAAPPDEAMQVLDDIVASSHRANDLLESTRAIFGRSNGERVFVDPGVILKSTLAMVAGSARAQNVSIRLVVEGQPGPVVINRLQFQQALLNLFQNAIEAMSLSDRLLRILLVRCCGRDDGRGVIIRVEDNGPGIAVADHGRIFDAFFTTRRKAAGMGLLIARSVIQAHGGTIQASPRDPVGTVFEIFLPAEGTVRAPPASQIEIPAFRPALVTDEFFG